MTARVMRMIRVDAPAGEQLSLSQGDTEALVADRYVIELNRRGHDMHFSGECRRCYRGFRRYPGAAVYIYSDFSNGEQCSAVQMNAYMEELTEK